MRSGTILNSSLLGCRLAWQNPNVVQEQCEGRDEGLSPNSNRCELMGGGVPNVVMPRFSHGATPPKACQRRQSSNLMHCAFTSGEWEEWVMDPGLAMDHDGLRWI